MTPNASTRRRVTAQIVGALKRGLVPWRMPWSGPENTGPPTNSLTRKPFRALDTLLLQLAAQQNGFHSISWATADQWQSLGARVMCPACVGTEAVSEALPLFNAAQVQGLQWHEPRPRSGVNYEAADRVIAASGAAIRFVPGVTAEYRYPPLDYIVYPLREQFEQGPGGLAAFYESLFHELMHHSEPRLGWVADYATNELRAEIGSCLLATRLGLPNLTDLKLVPNHTRFVGEWVEAMEADDGLIFRVAASAAEAGDYLLSFSHKGAA